MVLIALSQRNPKPLFSSWRSRREKLLSGAQRGMRPAIAEVWGLVWGQCLSIRGKLGLFVGKLERKRVLFAFGYLPGVFQAFLRSFHSITLQALLKVPGSVSFSDLPTAF